IISSHGYYEGAEGNKPEMVIPLTNRSRAIDLMFQAMSLMGGNKQKQSENKVVDFELVSLMKNLVNITERQYNVLLKILAKNPDLYIDGRKVSDVLSEIEAIKVSTSF